MTNLLALLRSLFAQVLFGCADGGSWLRVRQQFGHEALSL